MQAKTRREGEGLGDGRRDGVRGIDRHHVTLAQIARHSNSFRLLRNAHRRNSLTAKGYCEHAWGGCDCELR